MPRKKQPSGGGFSESPTRGGRPKWAPNDQHRAIVAMGCLCGFTEEQIAAILKVSVETMQKHLAHELEHGKREVVVKVAGNMAAIAMDKKNPKAVEAGKFILSTKGGFVQEKAVRFPQADDPAEGALPAPGQPLGLPGPSGGPTIFTLNIGGRKGAG